MSNLNTGTSSVGEDRFNKAANQEEALAIKKQLAELEAQKALMNFQSQAAQQYNNRLGILAQLVAKNAASNTANNVNWVGHTAAPNMPQFQPRFQGMFSGMLSDPWHQFVYQKEYENRRDRAIANQMDELYRRNQLDQINAAKGNQLDNLIAVMLNQPNTSMPGVGQLNSTYGVSDTGFPIEGSSAEIPTPESFRGYLKNKLGNFLQSEQDMNYAKLNNLLKDSLSEDSALVNQVYANRAEDKKALFADPLGFLGITPDGLAEYRARRGSDGIDLDESSRILNLVKRNIGPLNGEDAQIYNNLLGRYQGHYKNLTKNTSGQFNPSDYTDVNGEKYSNSRIEAIGKKFFEYIPANGWTKDQLAAAMAAYDFAAGSYRPYNKGWVRSMDKKDFDDWFDMNLADSEQPWGPDGISKYNDFLNNYGKGFILDSGDIETWKLSNEKMDKAKEALALTGYLAEQGMIDGSVYKAAKANFSNMYNSPTWGRSTALELFKKGNGATDKKNFTDLVGPFYKDNKFNPNLNPKEFSGKVISDIEAGLTRDEHIMSDPKYQELFLSDKIEDQEAAKRFLSSTYFYTGKNSNLSADDLNRKAKWVDNTYVRIKDMLQDRVKQRAAMPNNDIGNGIKNSIDKNFSDNSQTILKNVSNSQERKSITEDFSNLLKHVEGLPSHAYMDGGSSSGRVAILYGVDMKEALRASGVSPEEASKIANDAVKTKKNFGDLDPKYQKAILNYQNKVFQDKWNMGLSSFGVANSQGKRPSSILGIKDPQEARYFDLMVLQANWRGDGPGMRKYLNTISKATFQKEMDTRAKNKSNSAFPYVSAFLDLYKDFANRSKSKYVLLGSNGKGGRIGNIAKFFASKQKS